MISREKFMETTVAAMLVERAKQPKDFWQVGGEDLVNLAAQAYRALVEEFLSDLVPGRSPSEFLQSFTTSLDNMAPKSRRTLFAFLRDRYEENGERRCSV